MQAVIRSLNAHIQSPEQDTHHVISADDARLALHAIETQQLAVGALRLILANQGTPKNPALVAALDHGQKFLDLHDAYVAKHSRPAAVVAAPNPAPVAAAKKDETVQDVSDLC